MGALTVRGLLVFAACLLGASVHAAPISYDIDQALWGQASGPGAPFQAAQQAAVAANPSAFNYLQGQITVDWDNSTISAFDLDLDLNFSTGNATGSFTRANITTVDRVVTNSIGQVAQFRAENAFGPVLGSPPRDQYTSFLDFSLSRLTDGTLLLGLQTSGTEYVLFPGVNVGNPECGLSVFFGCTDSWSPVAVNLLITRTYGDAGVQEAVANPGVVPLPAAGWMLIASLGGLIALRRGGKSV